MSLTVRPLATPHDPPAGPVTVATPSCCCCCCCCLATLGTAIGFSAGAAYETAVRHRRPPTLPTFMALLALPLAVVSLVVLFGVIDDAQGIAGIEDELGALVWVAAIGVYLGLAGGGLRLAGAGWGQAAGVPAAVAVCIPVLFVIELPLALFTALIVELASPATLALGVWLGRTTHRGPAPPTWPTGLWTPPFPPPPAPPGPPATGPTSPPLQPPPAPPALPGPPITPSPTPPEPHEAPSLPAAGSGLPTLPPAPAPSPDGLPLPEADR